MDAVNLLSSIKLESISRWTASGISHTELIENLRRDGRFSRPRVREALLNVDRAHFCSETPYGDHPVPIGFGATISAPHMHASVLETLEPFIRPGATVLDVGSGSGYLLAAFSHLAGPTGRVFGVEHIPALVARSRASLDQAMKDFPALRATIEVVEGDGRLGLTTRPDLAFDAIHVGAAADGVPEGLTAQLRKGGRMVLPVERGYGQEMLQVDKDAEGHVTVQVLYGVRFVPLTDRQRQWPAGGPPPPPASPPRGAGGDL